MRDIASSVKSMDWSRLIPGAVITLAVLLTGCSGSTGAQGPAGATGSAGPQGPPGPTGPVTAINVGTATQITATITSVTFPVAPTAVKPVVKFTLINQVGEPLSGLTAAKLGFAVAKLSRRARSSHRCRRRQRLRHPRPRASGSPTST